MCGTIWLQRVCEWRESMNVSSGCSKLAIVPCSQKRKLVFRPSNRNTFRSCRPQYFHCRAGAYSCDECDVYVFRDTLTAQTVLQHSILVMPTFLLGVGCAFG